MKKQVSDSFTCGILLALSGGCMDAYSYFFRGHVFANAQTGNMLLLGVNLANKDFTTALKYVWPISAFIIGIVISDVINEKKDEIKIHWRQISVLIELIMLAIVAFIPENLNFIANAMISLVCGIQVESFRKINGNAIATTMCIGNLRSGTNNLVKYFCTKNAQSLRNALLYYGIIISFVIGSVIESWLISYYGTYAIFFSPMMLIIVVVIMFKDAEVEKETA